MKHGLWPTLAMLVIPFILGAALFGGGASFRHQAYVTETEARFDSIRAIAAADSARAAAAERDRLAAKAVADSATAAAEAARDSAALWYRRWATLPRPAPFDTAAWVRFGPGLLAGADSALAVCDSAIQSCHNALAAKDVEIAAGDSLQDALRANIAAVTSRADFAEGEWRTVSDRLARRIRWEKPKMGLSFAAGVGACVGVISLTR